jgi:hypothetical protein
VAIELILEQANAAHVLMESHFKDLSSLASTWPPLLVCHNRMHQSGRRSLPAHDVYGIDMIEERQMVALANYNPNGTYGIPRGIIHTELLLVDPMYRNPRQLRPGTFQSLRCSLNPRRQHRFVNALQRIV